MVHTVVVLGGAYAGLHVSHYLLKNNKDVKVVLVSKVSRGKQRLHVLAQDKERAKIPRFQGAPRHHVKITCIPLCNHPVPIGSRTKCPRTAAQN